MALSVRAASNLFISVVGAGVLGLPYAFKRSGLILGTVVMIVIAALNLHCMLLLVNDLCLHLRLPLLLYLRILCLQQVQCMCVCMCNACVVLL